MRRTTRATTGLLAGLAASCLLLAPVTADARSTASAPDRRADSVVPGTSTGRLAPRTHFTMRPDGSSGATQGGEGIPNIDSVKKTIAAYYGDPGTGIADPTSSPYITEVTRILRTQQKTLKARAAQARKRGEKPALVFDTDDTTLWTYEMEVAAMHFTFDPKLQDVWVQGQRFPAVPAMVSYVRAARRLGFTIFGVTGRTTPQKTATLANLRKVGYRGFAAKRFYTKWVDAKDQPGYLHCVASCTTVEYKAGTRAHIEHLGYDIVANYGDQWSDLQGGHADHAVKLPNPTYYLPSPNLPGLAQPRLAPRAHFTMKPDGSSGLRPHGDAIPNIDSVKKTIAVYYGDRGTGLADRTDSPYIREMTAIVQAQRASLQRRYDRAVRAQEKPALVFDADDTTLWTYDMEVAAMHFTFDPKLQDTWVQGAKFPATPAMVAYVNEAASIGFTVFGLTGRNADQEQATLTNLHAQGYRPFTAATFYTKWTGKPGSPQPDYVTCAKPSCTTVEYKAQTRKHIEQLGYTVVADYGDQYSDLLGGYADRTVKLPNPTYYLP